MIDFINASMVFGMTILFIYIYAEFPPNAAVAVSKSDICLAKPRNRRVKL